MISTRKFRQMMARSHGRSLLVGFGHGLAQMGSFGSAHSLAEYPKQDAAKAMKGDWERVAEDLNRGIEKVRAREKAKA